ncbi:MULTISPECIES: CPXCG motif-containing cysteine-rich protein [unclassified Thioalkalivibrio]|uniref:CPXCG motif-containing cysteine-rich protein n=1 Tax=unclassified Thioalkalivibrio TaxID=2621013 RepID=UPI00037797B4|nr:MULTISPECIES: CPXCG motif-containing cysteine-rich protein [unclassified Thioalkalivibrio]
MRPVEFVGFTCPWCGEPGETTVDMVSADQEWIEDCAVCCAPIVFRRVESPDAEIPQVEAIREGG